MSNNYLIFKNLEFFGDKYCRKYLDKWKPEILTKNWWEALKFFFEHSFARGRRDELSLAYHLFTINVLQEFFSIDDNAPDDSFYMVIKNVHFFDKTEIHKINNETKLRGKKLFDNKVIKKIASANPIIKILLTKRKVEAELNGININREIRLENEYDLFMVLDVLKFITSTSDKKNIYSYLLSILEKRGVKFTYDLLYGFYAIGDKIVSLINRDILLLNPDIKISEKDYIYSFPVDIWVKRIASLLECKETSDNEIKKYFINNSIKYNLNPLKVAAGIWFLGFNQLSIIIENVLPKIDLERSGR